MSKNSKQNTTRAIGAFIGALYVVSPSHNLFSIKKPHKNYEAEVYSLNRNFISIPGFLQYIPVCKVKLLE